MAAGPHGITMSAIAGSANPLHRRADITAPRALAPTFAGRALLLVILIGLGIEFGVVHPGRHWLYDFRGFYSAGRAVQTGLNPYDRDTLRQELAPELPGNQPLTYVPYPPPTLVIMAQFGRLPLEQAQIAWCLFQYALLITTLLLLNRTLGIPFGSPVSVLITTAFLFSEPVRGLFFWGQWDGIVVVLVAAAFCLLMRHQALSGGVFVALAGLSKLFPMFYFWVLVVRKQWRGLLAAGATVSVLMALSLALLSPGAREHYFVNTTAKLNDAGMYVPAGNMSIIGYTYRAFVDWPVGDDANVAWVHLGVTATWWIAHGLAGLLVLSTSWWIWRNRPHLNDGEALAAMVPVLLLITPIAWPHHCVQLVIPLALIAVTLARRQAGWFDQLWLIAIIGLYVFNPIMRQNVAIESPWRNLFTPTATYAIVLTWLYFMVRYVPLKLRQSPTATACS